MTEMLRNILILVFAHAVVSASQGNHCGRPPKYPDKRLDDKYIHTPKFKDGDKVAYNCPLGYTRMGGSRISYCEKGRWTPLDMKCDRKSCGPLSDFWNGQYSYTGLLFGDKATAVCSEGYVLRGEGVRVCKENGWDGTEPICERGGANQYVPPLLPVSVAIPSAPQTVKPSSTPCTSCSPPLINLNGTIKDPKPCYEDGDHISVICNTGYSGYGNYTCKGGKWVQNVKCQVVKCQNFNIDNGSRSGTRVRFNTSVKITCAKGFKLHGAQNIKCAANGSWTPDVPKCEPVAGKCDSPPVHPYAHPRDLQQRDYRSGDWVRYRCNVGYRRSAGRDIIHCTNGQWKKLELRCERKRCGSAGEIFNGHFEYSGVSYGDFAEAVCDEGYELIGPAKRHCRDGGWDGRNAECEAVHCPPPPVVKDAYMLDPEHDEVPFGRVVSYRCQTGTLIGAKDIYCTKNGDWSAPPPECKDVICPDPKVRHGSRITGYRHVYKFGNTARITCNPGYKLADGNIINCGEDGKWKPDINKMCVT